MAESARAGMSWLQKAALAAGRKIATWGGGIVVDTTDRRLAEWLGNGTYTGKSVTVRTSMQVSTVWACVRILAEGLGQLPLAIYERTVKNGKEDLKKVDHDLGERLIDAPNADMTSNEFREARMTNLGLCGNGYSFINRTDDGRRILSLTPIPSAYCRAMRRIDSQLVSAESYTGGELVYQINDRGRWETFPREKVWHNRIFSLNGVTGLSPISYARETMAFAMGLEEFGARIFGQGLHAGMTIEYPQWVPDEKRELVTKKLKEMQGIAFTGNPLLLEGGMKVGNGMIPPKDVEFLGLRGFGVDDICRFYLVPPHRVARLEKMTNNNIEQLSLEFVMYTLLPYIVKDERSADRWLFNQKDRGRFVVRYNYDGLLRGDSEARSKLEATWLQNAVVTPNEVRAFERLPRSDQPGMDEHHVQSNMISVDDLILVADAMRARGANKGATQ